jgi:hypothetical protein
MLYPYRESLISQLYPGWQHSSNCLQPAVEAFEQRLNLPPERRHKIVWRLDGGFGGDQNVEYLLGRGYHVLAKGASNRRAAKLAAQVKRWRALRADKVVGQVPTPEPFSRPVQTFVTRTQVGQRTRLAYLCSTLSGSGVQTARLYMTSAVGPKQSSGQTNRAVVICTNAANTNGMPKKSGSI